MNHGKRAVLSLFAAVVVFLAGWGTAFAEVSTIRVAEQYGIGYLPLQEMRDLHLIEKHARALGLGDIKVEWSRFGGGSAMNDALLSGNLDFASGGVGPLLVIWDRTVDNFKVEGVGCLNLMPLYLNTNDPKVKTIEDFTDSDRIALPAVKVSIQARTLEMAAAKIWGDRHYDKLDHLTVSMKHPDGLAALLSGGVGITAHLTSPPYQYQELQNPKVHKVLSSYDVLGGPSTFNCVWARSGFREENPKAYRAFVDALEEAMHVINSDRDAAADTYIRVTKSKLDRSFVRKIVNDPEIAFTITPKNTMKYAEFLYKVKQLKHKPMSWKDYFFPEIHDLPGS